MVKPKLLPLFTVVLFLLSQLTFHACSHKKDIKQLSKEDLQSKRVALVEIKGAPESKTQVEVAVINEILEHARFEIVDRATVQDALTTYPTESDWKRLGSKVDADYVMSVRIAEFKVDERQGYDKVVEEDSVLAEEAGQSKPVMGTRYQKIKAYSGYVRLNIIIFDVSQNAIIYQGAGQAHETQNSRDMKLPGKMRLLEILTHNAVTDFFEKMP